MQKIKLFFIACLLGYSGCSDIEKTEKIYRISQPWDASALYVKGNKISSIVVGQSDMTSFDIDTQYLSDGGEIISFSIDKNIGEFFSNFLSKSDTSLKVLESQLSYHLCEIITETKRVGNVTYIGSHYIVLTLFFDGLVEYHYYKNDAGLLNEEDLVKVIDLLKYQIKPVDSK